jgi:hypothetical protein
MPKVVITGHKVRKQAKDHKSIAPIHKPASKPKHAPANAQKPGLGGYSYAKAITPKQDKAYNSKKM